jgi:hypothetical protein
VSYHLTAVTKGAIGFAYVGGIGFFLAGVALTYRRRRLHPLLLLSLAAISISWIEAPYDWAVYAQFAPAIPRMPSWWPLNMTWGGLPASVPPGYISYFVTPALIGAWLGRRLSARYGWRRPLTLLTTGLSVGFVWALLFNGILGARLGVFYYGRVIHGLAIFEGSKHQYPLYDALAMGVQMMVFAYLLGRTDAEGRTVIDAWAARRAPGLRATALSVVSVALLANVLYGSVFTPHVIAKVQGWETAGPRNALFPGIPNQPLYGTDRGPRLGSIGLGPDICSVVRCGACQPPTRSTTTRTTSRSTRIRTRPFDDSAKKRRSTTTSPTTSTPSASLTTSSGRSPNETFSAMRAPTCSSSSRPAWSSLRGS